MNAEFIAFAQRYGHAMYSNEYVFFDKSRPSGLTSGGDDLMASWQAAQSAQRQKDEKEIQRLRDALKYISVLYPELGTEMKKIATEAIEEQEGEK